MVNKSTKVRKQSYQGQELEYRYVERSDLKNRLLSYMLDVIVMLSPMMIWNIIMLLVLGSLLSIAGIFVVNIVIAGMLIVSIFFFNKYISKQTKGQSLGMYTYGFKIIRNNGKKANKRQLWMRELLGNDIPFVVLMLFLNIFGVVLYWILNGIVVLIDKRHRCIIDFVTQTCVVVIVNEKEAVEQRDEIKEEPVAPVVDPQRIYNHIDLRVHSNFSNKGTYNVEEIFQEAKKKGIHTIAVTDTNTAKANSIAERMSELYQVHFIPGIEIDCAFHGRRTKILGYFIDYHNELYTTIENDSLLHEKNASIERVRKFERYLGMEINIHELLSNNRYQQIPGDMIAKHVLNNSKYANCDVLKPYLYGKMQNPYAQLNKDFFGVGKPCHVPVKYPNIKDILDVIALSDGIAVLANPRDVLSEPMLLDELVRMGVQGIEVFQPQHTRREMAELLNMTKKHKLFVTCGSDFYKNGKSSIGDCNCPLEAETIVDMFVRTK